MNIMILCVISEMNRSFQHCMKNDFFVGKVMSLLFNILSRLKRQKDMTVVELERVDLERFMEGSGSGLSSPGHTSQEDFRAGLELGLLGDTAQDNVLLTLMPDLFHFSF